MDSNNPKKAEKMKNKHIQMVIVAFIALFILNSCGQGNTTPQEVQKPSDDTVTNGAITTSAVGDPIVNSLTKDEMKKLLEQKPTFAEMKDKYNLRIIDEQFKYSTLAVSNKISEFEFYFNNDYDLSNTDRETFILTGINAPASIMLPEYVNMQVDQIPIALIDSRGRIQMVDNYGWYSIGFSDPTILRSDDIVTILPR